VGTKAQLAKQKRRLSLKRPIAVLDLETTGTEVELDRIVEIGVVKLTRDGRREVFHKRVNPGIKIPTEATSVHGISDKHVVSKPKFRAIAKSLLKFLGNCDLTGFNIESFDLPLLRKEFQRIEVSFPVEGRHVVDVKTIFHLKEPRNLTAAVKFYCERDHGGAHSAVVDAHACLDVLEGQLNKYTDLPNKVEELSKFSQGARKQSFLDSGKWFRSRNGKPIFAKGNKHRGQALSEVADEEPDYLEWMLSLSDLPDDTRKIVQKAVR